MAGVAPGTLISGALLGFRGRRTLPADHRETAMKRLLAALLLASVAFPAAAQTNVPGKSAFYQPLGYCQLTSMSSATLLSSCSGGIPAGTNIAEICVEAQSVRYRDDGVAPTSTIGIPGAVGCFQYAGLMSALQFIQTTAGAIVNVSFYK